MYVLDKKQLGRCPKILKKPLEYPYINILVDDIATDLIYTTNIAQHEYLMIPRDYNIKSLMADIRVEIEAKLKSYDQNDLKLIINNPDEIFKISDTIEFVHKVGTFGKDEGKPYTANYSAIWLNLRNYKIDWSNSIRKSTSISEMLNTCKRFENSIYIHLYLATKRIVQALTSNGAVYNGILVTGNNATSYLYNCLKMLYPTIEHMPILVNSYDNTILNGWLAFEMLRNGYCGRINPNIIAWLNTTPVGPLKKLDFVKYSKSHFNSPKSD